MGRKRRKATVHGWLALDKPPGLSSNAALGRVKRLFDCPRAGHAGTLDPLATGMLPIALGEATKTVPWIMDAAKSYTFQVQWGARTSTDDLEGEVIARSDARPTLAEIDALLPEFTGTITQVPPQYSAIRIDGERAYKLARAGEDVAMPEREVVIDTLARIDANDAEGPVQTALFECACGKGTYIRAIARDLGERLGCHGHVTSLRRTRVGPFAKDDMVTLETLEAAAEQGREALLAHLLALQSALPDMPRVEVGAQDAAMLGRGQAVLMRGRDAPVLTGPVCVMFEDRALALGECVAGSIHPRRVFQYS